MLHFFEHTQSDSSFHYYEISRRFENVLDIFFSFFLAASYTCTVVMPIGLPAASHLSLTHRAHTTPRFLRHDKWVSKFGLLLPPHDDDDDRER